MDYAALVVYCSAWSAFDQARKALETYGPLVEGRDGGFVKNPAAQIMKDSAAIMLNYGSRFGFTPCDRHNLGIITEAPEGDDLESQLHAL